MGYKRKVLSGKKMRNPIWVQKLSDKKLKELVSGISDVTASDGSFTHMIMTYEDVYSCLNTWYDDYSAKDGFMRMSIDVYKEAAFRWKDNY